MSDKETPLMKQYNRIKQAHPGALLLFRVGDFYETFGEDAIRASKILGIVLTRRANGAASFVELAGFPHHALDSYLPKLIRAGERVAVCDQLEDPKMAKTIVKRGVTELVTPGVCFNDKVLDQKQNNYLAGIHIGNEIFGIAFLDVSTGEFSISQGNKNYIEKLIQSFNPSEIIYPKSKKNIFQEIFSDKYYSYPVDEWAFSYDYAVETITQHFSVLSLKGFGIEELHEGIVAAGVLIHYLKETQHNELNHITGIQRLEEEQYVWLDKFTQRNLEILHSPFEGGVPLVQVMDKTVTPMGARTLRRWLTMPLKDLVSVQERLNAVENFTLDTDLLLNFQQIMKPIGDMERLISKVAIRRISPRELNQLKRAMQAVPLLKVNLQKNSTAVLLKRMEEQLNPCESIRDKIERELKPDPPLLTNQGEMIKDGINHELDELRKIAYSGKEYLLQIQETEAKKTAIPSLKISYNRVFGYYLEVTNPHKNKVPAEWIRKQTLTNAERYITPELKEYEEKILNAEEKIFEIEARLFNELVSVVAQFTLQIQQNSLLIGMLDVLCSYAEVALKNKFSKPVIENSTVIHIKQGRHPVIEDRLPLGESYVPNDVYLDDDHTQIMIITGPNMSGKSALLRQTALIVLLAQTGSFVPAESATIGLVDKIFTRVGASDNLSLGESTFMVEMNETASILNNVSNHSLVLLDEIGRGTSTYDGISIAWALVEYLHNHPKGRAKTLFATHYHELSQLADELTRVKNFRVSVRERENKIIFVRKLEPGSSEHSFGIHVARMAGMPDMVIRRAEEILHHLEKDRMHEKTKKKISEIPVSNFQLSLFNAENPVYEKIKKILESLDTNAITPVEALLKLVELKGLVKGEGN
ncbi:MAG: DNA mismatch repair protein MutS [Bacteroidetes bacterium RIFCSPLOWO2_02_FULL_36_8]|nr:MAG: DNA mismatch repair protein MutS [Bacteroidetes bacterium RIFCSPLOWO2_02_FULL_36_8]OFY70277.1 MAG: DNA mismatch repair protein MutS [Bacteroidetes bacterium RIFCSPLOWO2_12_FULL_37_12]